MTRERVEHFAQKCTFGCRCPWCWNLIFLSCQTRKLHRWAHHCVIHKEWCVLLQYEDFALLFKANARAHVSACCALSYCLLTVCAFTLSPEHWCHKTEYACVCVRVCFQGYKQSPWTQAGCWNIDHISPTYWKYCADLLRLLHCLRHSGSSGINIDNHFRLYFW